MQKVRLISLALDAKKQKAEKSPLPPKYSAVKGKFQFHTTWDFICPRFGHHSCNNSTVITELIAKIWQRHNIAKQKSDWAGNTGSQMIRQVVNKLPG